METKLWKKKYFFFFSKARKYGESEESEERELNGGERSVFLRNQCSKQLIEVLKCVYDVTISEKI